MLRRICCLFCLASVFAVVLTVTSFSLFPALHIYASNRLKDKPSLTLNRQQGPLGVTLTLNGKNFPPGQANLSYIDAQGVPGIFAPPGDSSVGVLDTGAFLTTNLILPASGPSGDWKIVVTDSLGNITTIKYSALAAPGQTLASAPTLTLNPTGGESGDTIIFSGANWLPKGTTVNLMLSMGVSSIPLLEPSPISDENGAIGGSFHLPANLNVSQATVLASDALTGALRASAPVTITGITPTPTDSPTAQPSPSPSSTVVTTAPSPATTPDANNASGGSNTPGFLRKLDPNVWGPVLLIVGGILGVAALMLVLFMLPWSKRGHHGGQY